MGWRTAQAEHGVVFFRDQELTPRWPVGGGSAGFGAINVNRFFTPVPAQPSVAMVLKEPQHETNVGGGWHTDHSYDDAPALGSLLYALEVPSRGGDTMFANMYSGLRRPVARASSARSKGCVPFTRAAMSSVGPATTRAARTTATTTRRRRRRMPSTPW